MKEYFQFLSFVLFYSLYYYTTSLAIPYVCPHDESLVLLSLKNSFTIDEFKSDYCESSILKTETWNKSTDCCSWEGITCDKITSNVVELDLSCSQLSGSIDTISILFGNFIHMTNLNLSSNNFSGEVSSEIFKLTKLTRLDLSSNSFIVGPDIFKFFLTNFTKLSHVYLKNLNIISSIPKNLSSSLEKVQLKNNNLHGKLPQSIFHLPNLNTLDLGGNSMLYGLLPSGKWNNNITLERLDLSYIQFSGKIPDSFRYLKALKYLDLSYCGFSGLLPTTIFTNMTLIETIHLSSNRLIGSLPTFPRKMKHLNVLKLDNNSFTGTILPFGILSFSSLLSLDLSNNHLSGPIPGQLSSLLNLEYLFLDNNQFSGLVPMELSDLVNLEALFLNNNQLSGSIPTKISNLVNLKRLRLDNNQISGHIPRISSLVNLQFLFLDNNQLSGPIPTKFSSLVNLQFLLLDKNQLSGPIPIELSNLVNLEYLFLDTNQLSGHVPMELSKLVNLQYLFLDNNQLSGPVPSQLSSLENLIHLSLSSNNLSGRVDVDIFSNMKQLEGLYLSHNSLFLVSNNNSTLPESITSLELASCNITKLEFIPSALESLDLSMNNIQEIPSWLWSQWNNIIELNISYNSITHVGEILFQQIVLLDLRSNLFQGQFPHVPPTISWMFIANNQFSGMVPTSIVCTLRELIVLDLSNNSFTGSIPRCIGNVSRSLLVLDMRMNKFQGTIPRNISSMNLTTLNLHGNHLRGNIPSSLATCMNLKVVDLGNNNLNDSFPSWLGVLPNLTVLSLRSNSFHGKINLSATSLFVKLQILDLSHNQFVGTLPPELFSNFLGMMQINETDDSPSYMGTGDSVFYEDSTTLVNKGTEVELVKILKTWTTIDLSSNNFEGSIPDSVGRLISVRQLNFSNNKLNGEIPISFKTLSVLESLDLSSNQLTGTIPTQLTSLNFLSKLNLSYNHLTGRIPSGPQFQTFGNDSYINNDGLCGIPLSETCGGNNQEHVVDNSYDWEFFDGFGWRCVLIGYGVGLVIGSWIGFLMIFTETPKWFIRMVEKQGYRIMMKRDKKKKISKQSERKN